MFALIGVIGNIFLPQSELAVDPALYVVDPEEQGVQEVAPTMDEYIPTGQEVQNVCRATEEYVPKFVVMNKMFLPQSELDVDPVLYVVDPVEQEVQEVAPAVEEYVPMGHAKQTVPLT